MPTRTQPGRWVLLSYRMPREPSTPRIAVWRKLERLGAARLGDGLVGLPADARTREQLGWIAEEVIEAGGAATVWLATPATTADEESIADGMRAARAAEYEKLIAQATTADRGPAEDRARAQRQLRDELRRVERRDYYPPPQREQARRAVESITDELATTTTTTTARPTKVPPTRTGRSR